MTRSGIVLAAMLCEAGLARSAGQTGSDWIDVRNFGARGDGATDDSFAVQAALFAAGGAPIFFPRGRYRMTAVAGTSAHFVGEGASESLIELSSDGTDSIFEIDQIHMEGLGFSDRGRASMDHTENSDVFLFECTDAFQAENCIFLTDRSVLSQIPTALSKWTIVRNCVVARVNEPVAGEADRMNLFACAPGVPFIHFDNLVAKELAARSVANATYTHLAGHQVEEATAVVENCRFEYIHNSDDLQEVKVIFLQGYKSTVAGNTFIDCFGRHIDLLGNFHSGSAVGIHRLNQAIENRIRYSMKRQTATGSGNDEAGSIYCRYADVRIAGNHLDFSNLRLSSAGYNGISVRHGYRSAYIERNEVIAAKAHAIEADISDSIDTDDAAVEIVGNSVSSARSTRLPISIANNSKKKLFASVELRDNSIDYPFGATAIVFDRRATRMSPFGMKYVHVEGNRNVASGSLDAVDFKVLPKDLFAPNTDVRIRIDPAALNTGLPDASLDAVVEQARHYRCRSVTFAPISVGAAS